MPDLRACVLVGSDLHPGPLLRCACGTTDLVAVAPGSDDERVPGGFVLVQGTPARGWCSRCWQWWRVADIPLAAPMPGA